MTLRSRWFRGASSGNRFVAACGLYFFLFHCRPIGSEVCLLAYTLIQNKIRKSRRLTVWRRTEVGWKILFHQGTIVQDGLQDG